MAAVRRRKNDNRAGKRCIGLILVAFVAAMSVQIVNLYQKDQEYIRQQTELEDRLQEQIERQAELEQYEAYTQTPEYVEDIARSKLGLSYGDEIIFKETP